MRTKLRSRLESIILEHSGHVAGTFDENVLEYIVDVLREMDDEEEIREVLEPMVEDLWCGGDHVVTSSLVDALIGDAGNWDQISALDTDVDDDDKQKEEGRNRRGPCAVEEQQVGKTTSTATAHEQQQGKSVVRRMTEEQERAVTMLASLLSLNNEMDAHRDYLLHMYMSCRSNVDAAANLLLGKTGTEIQEEIEARERQRSCGEDTGCERLSVDPEIKASIVSKYHLQAVSSRERETSSSTRQRKKENEFMMKRVFSGDEGKKGGASVRFRDGAVVTTKGEKYITEKKDEWDGGSRGRVKAKGKRGVGWV